jgi:hypothetical protein
VFCGRCGAVIAISSPGGEGASNEQKHEDWHRWLDDQLRTR